MADCPIGTVVAFVLKSSNIPTGWLPCDGSLIPSEYADLITALGGNNTPDLRGRTLIGAGAASNASQSDGTVPNFPSTAFVVGENGGEYAHVLVGGEVPPHCHHLSVGIDTESGSSDSFWIPPLQTDGPTYDPSAPAAAHNTMQPYYIVNYIICADDSD